MYPYQRLREEGYEVHIAAPTAKKLQFVVHDFVDGFDTYTEKPGHTWPADVAFADVNPEDYVALVVPDMVAAGAQFVDGEAVVDGVVVSGRAWPDHPAWMREFMKVLLAKAPVS